MNQIAGSAGVPTRWFDRARFLPEKRMLYRLQERVRTPALPGSVTNPLNLRI